MRPDKLWTLLDDLKAMRAGGHTYSAMREWLEAQGVIISISALHRRMRENGVPREYNVAPGEAPGRQRTRDRWRRWAEMREQGMTCAKIAKRDGVTESGVWRALQRLAEEQNEQD